MLTRSSLLITLSAVLSVPVPSLMLLGILLGMFVRPGQDVSPGKCVLLCTSESVRKG